MHPRDTLHGFLIFDLLATASVGIFVWLSALSFRMVAPPDMSGVPLTVPELQRMIAPVLLWCWGWATIAAGVNFFIVRWMGRRLDYAAGTTQKLAWCSALTHWVLLLLPPLAPTYQFGMLHTTFKL